MSRGDRMGKTYIDSLKYVVYADVEIQGLVEKPDVVGAIFGQTEGLLGDELDLRDLQKNGRIGRIEVELTPTKGKTKGTIRMPSSLDMVETCILAAALETVDRVGPCEAQIKVQRVEDTRNIKRKQILERAKALLKHMIATELPESKEMAELVREEVKAAGIIEYGKDRLPAGPMIDKSDSIILVEGRADVLNLLKNDMNNVIAIGGASQISDTIIDLCKKKEATVFLDGDHGGDIILHQLLRVADVDYVARAPRGKEVEELTRKEMIKCLRARVPAEQAKDVVRYEHTHHGVKRTEEPKREQKEQRGQKKPVSLRSKRVRKPKQQIPENYIVDLRALENTMKARLYDRNGKRITEIQVRDVIKSLEKEKGIDAVVFDGIVTQRLVDLAESKGVSYLVGLKLGNVFKKPETVLIYTKT